VNTYFLFGQKHASNLELVVDYTWFRLFSNLDFFAIIKYIVLVVYYANLKFNNLSNNLKESKVKTFCYKFLV